MVFSRIKRFEEKKQKKRLALTLLGSLAVLAFFAIFGLKILIGFSVLVDTIRGNPPSVQNATQSLLLPPTLDPVIEATNSARINITGKANSGSSVVVYVNDVEVKRVTTQENGTFAAQNIRLREGVNAIKARLTDEKNNQSDYSQPLSVRYKKIAPKLEITEPEPDSTITGETAEAVIKGNVEEDVTITINGRFVVVLNDGSFSYTMQLTEGSNTATIVATDDAGNTTMAERTVTYQK